MAKVRARPVVLTGPIVHKERLELEVLVLVVGAGSHWRVNVGRYYSAGEVVSPRVTSR